MSSALAKQLREIQQADQVLGGVSAPAGKRASFLFDPKQAADYDAESIYALGMAGLQELQQADPLFLRYQPILFSSKAVDMDRALLSKNENEEIDGHIKIFLRYLSPYFLQKPAHKVLEWLIRKYRINEMNVEAVIDCILPYHETPAFVRMVQILYFKEGDKWGFLFDVKKNAKTINRTFLAIRCLADRSIIDAVHDSALWHANNAAEMKKKNGHVIPFFTYLVLEYLDSLKTVELTHVTHILPIVTAFMAARKTPDLQLSGYMIFSIVAEKFQFSEKALNEVILTAAKSCAETCVTELLLLLAELLVRGTIRCVSAEALKVLSATSNIIPALKKASSSHDIKILLSQFKLELDTLPNSTDLADLKALITSLT